MTRALIFFPALYFVEFSLLLFPTSPSPLPPLYSWNCGGFELTDRITTMSIALGNLWLFRDRECCVWYSSIPSSLLCPYTYITWSDRAPFCWVYPPHSGAVWVSALLTRVLHVSIIPTFSLCVCSFVHLLLLRYVMSLSVGQLKHWQFMNSNNRS